MEFTMSNGCNLAGWHSYAIANACSLMPLRQLGGNSGSCVIDLQTRKVIGLHFGGRYQESNFAVMLAKPIDDPLLRKRRLISHRPSANPWR